MRRPVAWVRGALLSLLLLLLLAYTSPFDQISSPNERSRLYLAVALVDHHSLSIDAPLQRFGNIMDIAVHEGRSYSDKAPGSSLFGALVYGVARQLGHAEGWTAEALLRLMRRAMLPVGLVGFWVLRALLRRVGVLSRLATALSLAWLTGTAAFHYSAVYYGHQLVAVALAVALLALLRAEDACLERPWRGALLAAVAGTAAGMAGVTEYQAGVPAALLTVALLAGPLGRRPAALAGFFLGAAPWLVGLGVYNTLAFGGPLELSYHHLRDASLQSIHNAGVGGVTTPSWTSAFGGLLSWHRGLFSTSPLFLLALPGLLVGWRRGARRLTLLLAASAAYFLWFIVSSNMWVAGWGYGPRLLIPGMPWAMLLVGLGVRWAARTALGEGLVRGCLLAGLLGYQLVHAFFPEPPNDAANPLVDVVWPLWQRSLCSPNLGQRWLGLQGLTSLWPLLGLALLALGVLLAWPSRPRSVAGRVLVGAVALGVPAGLALGAWLTGPTPSQYLQGTFLSFVEAAARGFAR